MKGIKFQSSRMRFRPEIKSSHVYHISHRSYMNDSFCKFYFTRLRLQRGQWRGRERLTVRANGRVRSGQVKARRERTEEVSRDRHEKKLFLIRRWRRRVTYECALRSWLSGSVRGGGESSVRHRSWVFVSSESCAVSGAAGTGAIRDFSPRARRKIVNNQRRTNGEGAERGWGESARRDTWREVRRRRVFRREGRGEDSVRVRRVRIYMHGTRRKPVIRWVDWERETFFKTRV